MLLKVLIMLLEKALITVTVRQSTKLRQRSNRYSILFLKAIGNAQWELFEKMMYGKPLIATPLPYLHEYHTYTKACVYFSPQLKLDHQIFRKRMKGKK